MTASILPVLAASRPNPAWVNLGLPLAIGLLVAAVGTGLYYADARKKGVPKDGAFWQKIMLYGVCGLVAGYFCMRITIKRNPGLFGNKPPLSDKALKAISENPLGQHPEAGLSNPMGAKPAQPQASRVPDAVRKRHEEQRLLHAEQVRQEREAHLREQREKQQQRVRQMREESEARIARRKAELEEAQLKREALRRQDEQYLESLGLLELQQVRDQRAVELEQARDQMRAPAADGEDRRARSERFSAAVTAYQAASRILAQKRIKEANAR